jgi:hypothetical protein
LIRTRKIAKGRVHKSIVSKTGDAIVLGAYTTTLKSKIARSANVIYEYQRIVHAGCAVRVCIKASAAWQRAAQGNTYIGFIETIEGNTPIIGEISICCIASETLVGIVARQAIEFTGHASLIAHIKVVALWASVVVT